MKDTHTETGRLVQAVRVRTSAMGNPTWEVTIDGIDGVHEFRTTFKTQTNASVGYEVSNYRIGRNVILTLTRNERIVGMAYEDGERA